MELLLAENTKHTTFYVCCHICANDLFGTSDVAMSDADDV